MLPRPVSSPITGRTMRTVCQKAFLRKKVLGRRMTFLFQSFASHVKKRNADTSGWPSTKSPSHRTWKRDWWCCDQTHGCFWTWSTHPISCVPIKIPGDGDSWISVGLKKSLVDGGVDFAAPTGTSWKQSYLRGPDFASPQEEPKPNNLWNQQNLMWFSWPRRRILIACSEKIGHQTFSEFSEEKVWSAVRSLRGSWICGVPDYSRA